MRLLFPLGAAVFLFATIGVRAQEVPEAPRAEPTPEPTQEPLPSGSTPETTDPTQTLPLIPETPANVEKPAAGESPTKPESPFSTAPSRGMSVVQKMNKLDTVEALALKVRFRDVRTKVFGDADIQEALARAAASKTDYERRQWMFRHYELLYSRIEKMDPTLKQLVIARHNDEISRLKETKIEPTHKPDNYDGPAQVSTGQRKKAS